MNIQELMVPFGVFTMMVGGLVKLLLLQHQKRMDERFNELKAVRDQQDSRISEIDQRVTRVEEKQNTGVRHSDVMSIERALAKVAADTENNTRLLTGLNNQVETIRTFLLEK